MRMFIAEDDAALAAKVETKRRVHRIAFEFIDLAMVGAVFIDGVDPGIDAVCQRRVDVGAQSPGAIGIDRGIGGDEQMVLRGFGNAIDDAAAAAASKDHGIGSLEDLQSIYVIEITVILNVVAHAVDEKAGGRAVAAQGRLVAVAFARPGGGAGNIA
jgi:hypothetical protein